MLLLSGGQEAETAVSMESTEQLLTILEREEISLESDRSDLPAGMRA